jgi:hypothetical protein
MTSIKAVKSQRQNKTRLGDWPSRIRKGLKMSSLVDRGHSRKLPVDLAHFPARLTAKLGNVDSRNLTCAVVLATLERWNIPHADGVAYVQRAEARNLRRAWFGPRGVRTRPAGMGTMLFQLFDGFLRMEFTAPLAWEEDGRWRAQSPVRITVSGIGQ